ncbi:MAG TPA: hypothetical protein VNT50_04425, partial [Microbacterium sp.]|uniref:hypothetical protein n=1 Tax=Microbacterium sp. TaxID=51671 RepID=UPI002C2727C8
AETVDELPSPHAARADLVATLATLNAGLPDAKIFVASIPNLTQMYLAARDSAQARLTWAVTGFCPVLLSDPLDRSPAAVARRASVETRVNALNIVIRAACAAAERCWHDGDAVHDVPIALGDISTRDYFHPSIEGQAKIAAATWDKVIEKGVLESGHTVTTFDDVSPRIAWSGTWATTSSTRDFGGSVRYPKTLGAGYYLRFTGTKVLIEARTTPSSGISEVRIDGKLVGKIDGYSPMTRYRQIVFESGALPSGAHTLIVSATPEKFPESSGRNAILDAIIVEDAGW